MSFVAATPSLHRPCKPCSSNASPAFQPEDIGLADFVDVEAKDCRSIVTSTLDVTGLARDMPMVFLLTGWQVGRGSASPANCCSEPQSLLEELRPCRRTCPYVGRSNLYMILFVSTPTSRPPPVTLDSPFLSPSPRYLWSQLKTACIHLPPRIFMLHTPEPRSL